MCLLFCIYGRGHKKSYFQSFYPNLISGSFRLVTFFVSHIAAIKELDDGTAVRLVKLSYLACIWRSTKICVKHCSGRIWMVAAMPEFTILDPFGTKNDAANVYMAVKGEHFPDAMHSKVEVVRQLTWVCSNAFCTFWTKD